jgi:hypothetical protein
MINMVSRPTPGIPLQSEHSLDKNGLQFGFIALINQRKQNNFLGQSIETNELIWLLKTRQNY